LVPCFQHPATLLRIARSNAQQPVNLFPLRTAVQQGTCVVQSPSTPAVFDATRMRRYSILIIAIFLLSAVVLVASSHDMIDPQGKPLGYDFITFWGASDLTLHGKPEAAFDAAQTLAAQKKAIGDTTVSFFWHYPPTFQLLVTPLALAPYIVFYLLFISLGFAAYLFALRPLLNQPHPLLLLAAFPPTLLCLYHGQNSVYSAALLGCAVWLSEKSGRRALLAGACVGLLAYKPQLGILAPLAFAAAGQWRLFATAAITAIAFAGLATLVFGVGLWSTFLGNFPFVQTLIEDQVLPWRKMPSIWVFARGFGLPTTAAYVLQAISALAAAGVTIYVWRRCGMTRLSWAVLVSATLLVPHYVFDYELTLLAIPCAILASDMAERGASRREKGVLLAIFAIAGATAPITGLIQVQIGFPLLAATLWLTTRRALLGAKPLAPILPIWRRRERPA